MSSISSWTADLINWIDMGGCCCCSSKSTESTRTPVYLYCPQASEEREPLSSALGSTSAISSGLLFLPDLETSSPDTYRAPPPPLPYDMDLGGSQMSGNKAGPELLSDSLPVGETVSDDLGKGCPKAIEDKPSKLSAYIMSPVEEEDVCPICLEEYDTENPRIDSKCEHHFHLSCILEWMERSDICPMCDQIMVIDQTFSE